MFQNVPKTPQRSKNTKIEFLFGWETSQQTQKSSFCLAGKRPKKRRNRVFVWVGNVPKHIITCQLLSTRKRPRKRQSPVRSTRKRSRKRKVKLFDQETSQAQKFSLFVRGPLFETSRCQFVKAHTSIFWVGEHFSRPHDANLLMPQNQLFWVRDQFSRPHDANFLRPGNRFLGGGPLCEICGDMFF